MARRPMTGPPNGLLASAVLPAESHRSQCGGSSGQNDAKMTLEVYQQPLPSKFDERGPEWLPLDR
jgi:hypothetical protein